MLASFVCTAAAAAHTMMLRVQSMYYSVLCTWVCVCKQLNPRQSRPVLSPPPPCQAPETTNWSRQESSRPRSTRFRTVPCHVEKSGETKTKRLGSVAQPRQPQKTKRQTKRHGGKRIHVIWTKCGRIVALHDRRWPRRPWPVCNDHYWWARSKRSAYVVQDPQSAYAAICIV